MALSIPMKKSLYWTNFWLLRRKWTHYLSILCLKNIFTFLKSLIKSTLVTYGWWKNMTINTKTANDQTPEQVSLCKIWYRYRSRDRVGYRSNSNHRVPLCKQRKLNSILTTRSLNIYRRRRTDWPSSSQVRIWMWLGRADHKTGTLSEATDPR